MSSNSNSPAAPSAPTATAYAGLVILGATGGIGRQLVEQALTRGHEVTAVVRDPERLPVRHSRLTVQVANVTSAEELTQVLAAAGAGSGAGEGQNAGTGAIAVLSALGPRPGDSGTVTADGIEAALAAMKTAGVRRLLAVSAVPVGPPHGFVGRRLTFPMLWRFFGDGYRGLARMEELLKASDADWTVVRPPRLTDKEGTGKYRLGWDMALPWMTSLARADVADAMLSLLDDTESFGRAGAVG
jgi:putative NADH-flavin reductase